MASYRATVTSPHPPEQVYAFLADFRSVAEWDPSITSSELTAGVAGEVGSAYRVVTETTGPDVVLDYTTTEVDPPLTVALKGENDSLTSVDTITVDPADGGGSAVTYDAVLELKGLRKIADPLLGIGFHRLGDKARDGLARRLAEPLSPPGA
jgi:uncharacterized protein YndB with AHSA1/START domain